MTITEKFRGAVKSGDMALAKIIIDESLELGLEDQDRGAMLVSASLAYMKLVNDVNASYKEKLEEIIKSLKSLKAAEKEELKDIKMEKVRAELNS